MRMLRLLRFRGALLAVLVFVFLSAFIMSSVQEAQAFSGGDGTSGTPYLIANVSDLAELNSYSGSTHVGKYWKLTADINLNVAPYNAGTGWTPLSSFYGNIDGDGHTISNLYINATGGSKGLFSNLSGTSEVKNLHLSGVNITGSGSYVGALAGQVIQRTITNVSSSGTVANASSSTGGLIGSASSATINAASSSASVTVTGSNTATGGLVGTLSGTTISNSSATGTVVGGSYRTGGLIGSTDSTTVINRSFATGNVSDSLGEIGGLVGALFGDINDSYATGSVTSANLAKGGLVGFMNDAGATIVRSYAVGAVSGTGNGLLGGQYAGSCSNSFWDTQTTGRSSAGCSSGATGKTTAQMKNVDTFTLTGSAGLLAPWDFSGNPNNDVSNNNYWNIDGVANSGYPFLNGFVVNASPSVTALGPASYVNGSWGVNVSPTLNLTTNDTDSGNTVQYRIQLDNDSNFASPEVDYSSALASPGSNSFTVGQAAGGGTYTAGSSGQVLADGQYYWRVKAIDNSGAESGYVVANGGSVAFGIDTTAPSAAGSPTTATPTNDTTPTISWTAASDGGAGLDATYPYSITWSPTPDFTGVGTISTSLNTTSYTISSPLTPGTWYLRVRVYDALLHESTASTGMVVIDTSAPTPQTLLPASGSSSAGLADNLVLTFNEAVQVGTGSVTIKKTSDNSTLQAINVAGGQVTGTGTSVITVNPSVNFDEYTAYYIQISAGALVDLAGNAYGGISDTTTWSFTTVDLTSPVVNSPAANTAWSDTIPINIVFSEPWLNGTQQLIFTGSTTVTMTLNELSVGSHAFSLNTTNLFTASQIASASGSLIPEGTYTVTLSMRDASNSVTLTTVISSVTVDRTSPTLPGAPESTSTATAKPTWSWVVGSDSGSGLSGYNVQWSQDISFASVAGSSASSTNNFTHASNLVNGIWYFRVQSVDKAGNRSDFIIASNPIVINVQSSSDVSAAIPQRSIVASPQRSTASGSTSTIQESLNEQQGAGGSKQLLNDYIEFTNGSGKILNLEPGQIVYFNVNSVEHSATIKSVGTDYIVVTIASTPQDTRLTVGQSGSYDVDGDGSADVEVVLTGIKGAAALLSFKALGSQVGDNLRTETVVSHHDSFAKLIFGLLGGFILVVTTTRLLRQYLRAKRKEIH